MYDNCFWFRAMNPFDSSPTYSYFTDGQLFDLFESSDFPITNASLTIGISDDQHGNNTLFAHCHSGGPNNLGRFISMILFTVVCIIGLFGNSLVIYVVLRYVQQNTTFISYVYIFNKFTL